MTGAEAPKPIDFNLDQAREAILKEEPTVGEESILLAAVEVGLEADKKEIADALPDENKKDFEARFDAKMTALQSEVRGKQGEALVKAMNDTIIQWEIQVFADDIRKATEASKKASDKKVTVDSAPTAPAEAVKEEDKSKGEKKAEDIVKSVIDRAKEMGLPTGFLVAIFEALSSSEFVGDFFRPFYNELRVQDAKPKFDDVFGEGKYDFNDEDTVTILDAYQAAKKKDTKLGLKGFLKAAKKKESPSGTNGKWTIEDLNLGVDVAAKPAEAAVTGAVAEVAKSPTEAGAAAEATEKSSEEQAKAVTEATEAEVKSRMGQEQVRILLTALETGKYPDNINPQAIAERSTKYQAFTPAQKAKVKGLLEPLQKPEFVRQVVQESLKKILAVQGSYAVESITLNNDKKEFNIVLKKGNTTFDINVAYNVSAQNDKFWTVRDTKYDTPELIAYFKEKMDSIITTATEKDSTVKKKREELKAKVKEKMKEKEIPALLGILIRGVYPDDINPKEMAKGLTGYSGLNVEQQNALPNLGLDFLRDTAKDALKDKLKTNEYTIDSITEEINETAFVINLATKTNKKVSLRVKLTFSNNHITTYTVDGNNATVTLNELTDLIAYFKKQV